MASLFAHEVNNLLTQLAGRTQLALMRPEDPDLSRHALQSVQDCCARAEQLTQLFLIPTSAQGSSGADARLSLQSIHERVCGAIRSSDCDRLGFELHDETEGYMPDLLPIVLEQILQNLLLNAIRAIEEHPEHDSASHCVRVVAECSMWNTPTTEHEMRIEVIDTGVGMSPRQVAQLNSGEAIDEPTHPTSQRHRRHGLGMRVCRKLLSTVGGTLHCDSTPNHGTRITIRVPALKLQDQYERAAA